ncbi:glycoside hydrolase family 42 [Saccharobesus litoralis]|uniref:Glycoside hydrolase family 42 n=2 Tax=Saccharobesus litoralis TaxID=2172099 RepID=A0A2S0VXD0_9ALTE|nr:glycoside hydrolase family 42 [Saccharobesus litoralis]
MSCKSIGLPCVLSLAVSLAACGEKSSTAAASKTEATSPTVNVSSSNLYETTALKKIKLLENLMASAQQQKLDVTREETLVWFAKEFLNFANWDEQNQDAVAYMFNAYGPFKNDKDKLAAELPDFQRKKVIEILDAGIDELNQVISGEIVRPPVRKVDWQNTVAGDNMFVSNGKPIFLYDYFSKSVGQPLGQPDVYNDHLGAIYHGGENLYPVDHDRAINSFLLNEDGTWNEALMKEVTDISDDNIGFLIYWNMGLPEWIEKQEPEARKGRSLFTGFDIDNPLVRDVWGKIAKHTGELTKDKKVSRMGYILSNEPHYYSEKNGDRKHWSHQFKEMNDISSYTLNNFRTWLDNKYSGDIATLNKNWQTSFFSFDKVEIDIPIDISHRGKPMWYDWNRYHMDRTTNWFTYLQGELRKGNPDAHTSIKIMPNMFSENTRSHGIDVEALTDLTSMIGNDAQTREKRKLNFKKDEEWQSHYGWYWEELSTSYDFMESVSPNKIHFNSESHFLSASWWRDMDPSVEYVHSVYWLATMQGMDANLAWFWARDPDGSPEDRLEGEMNFFDPALAGSFAGSNNQQPHISNAFTQVMYDMNSLSEEIVALREQRRPIRLFYSETSAINKPRHMTEHFKMYEKIFFDGFPVGYATQNIINKQDNSSWDAILVYKTEFVTADELAALQSYLDQGGTVIVDSALSLSKNEYAQPHAKALKASKGKLIELNGKADEAELREVALKAAESGLPDLVLTEDNGTSYKGVNWRVVKQADGSYLANLNNLGKHTAKLKLTLKDGSQVSAKDMLTGKVLDSEFELAPKGVLMLEVSVK